MRLQAVSYYARTVSTAAELHQTRADEFLGNYLAEIADRPGIDEMVEAGAFRTSQRELIESVIGAGHSGLARARRRAEHFIHDDGVTYGTALSDESPGPWRIDPLPVIIAGDEWTSIERGLAQRNELLRRIFDDVYGEQRLLRSRKIPAEVVLGHHGYVRQAAGIPQASKHLILSATDLGRNGNGDWVVIDDRLQAPSGAGYAMATRRIVAQLLPRVHRMVDLAKLRGFFHTMTAAVLAVAPETDGEPRSVMLSPGHASETAFDQAFMASLLGFPLVEADDLVVQSGRVWLRASHGLVPVDAVMRRVDETWVDPLDLRGNSRLGVPGLLETVRQQHTAVLNPIGAGVLENPGFVPLLPELCRELLGEEQLLPSAETWWCGDDVGRSHVLANLEQLLLKPIHRTTIPHTIPGWELSNTEREELRQRIEAEPWAWTGQQPLTLSSAPVVTDTGVEARRFVLRTFGVRLADEHVLMPGGLGRVGATRDTTHITNASGALAKDVWIVGGSENLGLPVLELVGERRRPVREALGFEITPRGADNLYWFGRYSERTDATVRFLAVANDLANDHGAHPDTPGGAALARILEAVSRTLGVRRLDENETAVSYLRKLVDDRRTPGTVGASVIRLELAAQYVRELLSGDTWPVLASLERAVDGVPGDDDELQPIFDELLGPLLSLQGIVAHGLYRDASWAFVDAGIRMERAQFTLGLLRSTLSDAQSPVTEYLVSEAVLGIGDSTMTNRRRIAAGQGPRGQVESTLDLLLTEPDNPRSVMFQIVRIARNLSRIGDERLAARVHALGETLAAADVDQLTDRRSLLITLLDETRSELQAVSDEISRRHFNRQAPQSTFQQRWYADEREEGWSI